MNFKLKLVHHRALKLMLEALQDVKRFSGDSCVLTENTVYDHIMSLINIIGELDIDQELRDDLAMRALIHDMGELCGELTTMTDELSGNAIPLEKKRTYEKNVFKVFCHFAVLCIHDKKPLRFEGPLRAMRNIIDGPYSEGDVSVDTVIDYLEDSYKNMVRHTAAFTLEDMYEYVMDYDSREGKIFKVLDMIEGNEFYNDHAVGPEQVENYIASRYMEKVSEVIGSLEDGDLERQLAQRLQSAAKKYQSLVRGEIS